jgi:hypothetical protein
MLLHPAPISKLPEMNSSVLTPEDQFKLHVLLASALAIRIHEASMSVVGLTDAGEARVVLNPDRAPERYLKSVRELLSTEVLGSPGGYPVFMRRWTRMGQVKNTRLEPLLLLGEEEAAIAAARAPGLNETLARRVWWALPTAEVARYLLENDPVAQSPFAPELAAWLLEYLPFEETPLQVIHTVRLVLRPGLINAAQRRELWQRGARKTQYCVGFLAATPRALPDTAPPRRHVEGTTQTLAKLAGSGNHFAERLLWLHSGAGQVYLATLDRAWQKPADQEVVVALFEAMAAFFRPLRCAPAELGDPESLRLAAGQWCACHNVPEALAGLLHEAGAWREEIEAMLTLAHADEPLVRPIFARSDAVGTVMQKQIEPVAALLRRATPATRSTELVMLAHRLDDLPGAGKPVHKGDQIALADVLRRAADRGDDRLAGEQVTGLGLIVAPGEFRNTLFPDRPIVHAHDLELDRRGIALHEHLTHRSLSSSEFARLASKTG